MNAYYLQKEAFEAEKLLLSPDRWHEAPDYVRKMAEDEMGSGPVGIANHPRLGWCLVMSGQGPFIAWSENE